MHACSIIMLPYISNLSLQLESLDRAMHVSSLCDPLDPPYPHPSHLTLATYKKTRKIDQVKILNSSFCFIAQHLGLPIHHIYDPELSTTSPHSPPPGLTLPPLLTVQVLFRTLSWTCSDCCRLVPPII